MSVYFLWEDPREYRIFIAGGVGAVAVLWLFYKAMHKEMSFRLLEEEYAAEQDDDGDADQEPVQEPSDALDPPLRLSSLGTPLPTGASSFRIDCSSVSSHS